MGLNFYLAISCIGGAFIMLTLLMKYNLENLRKSKQLRVESNRLRKQLKNDYLRRELENRRS